MARPQNNRFVSKPPVYKQFKPAGVAARFLEKISLSLDEYEALRLSDYEGMSQQEAADEMNISRPTFTRLIEGARKKMIEFMLSGKMLTIEGGNIHFRQNIIKCNNCGQMFVINIENSVESCPSCSSTDLINLAGGFGHGQCCINHLNKGGSNHAENGWNRAHGKRGKNR